MARKKSLLIVSQVYLPDPASVGQHLADVAAEMVRRGWQVRVLTADRGYDDPRQRYPRREFVHGVEVLRLPFSSFGKGSFLKRIAAQLSFVLQAGLRCIFCKKADNLLVSTSPPMAAVVALAARFFRRSKITYWVMDLNPDQAVTLGAFRPDSPFVKVLELVNREILKRADEVVVLDRFMQERVNRKLAVPRALNVIPPWNHEMASLNVQRGALEFRKAHSLEDKLVFMFSGNMSPASPLTTILEATRAFRADRRAAFVFIGGGLGRHEVQNFIKREQPSNLRLLPYQPLAQLESSLSAADVHLVTLGKKMVGIIHPCKVYGALAVGRPVLYCGPAPAHITDIFDRAEKGAAEFSPGPIGWRVDPENLVDLVAVLHEILQLPRERLLEMGERGRAVVQRFYVRQRSLERICDLIES